MALLPDYVVEVLLEFLDLVCLQKKEITNMTKDIQCINEQTFTTVFLLHNHVFHFLFKYTGIVALNKHDHRDFCFDVFM